MSLNFCRDKNKPYVAALSDVLSFFLFNQSADTPVEIPRTSDELYLPITTDIRYGIFNFKNVVDKL